MKKTFLLLVTILFSLITFSQTKLFLNINDLRDPYITCCLVVFLEQEGARFPYYQYLVENDTINDIVYLNGAERNIELPFDGRVISENVKIDYGIFINGVVYEGVLNEKLVMDSENYFIFRIKENAIVIEIINGAH